MSAIDSIKSPIRHEMEAFQPYFKKYLHSNGRLLNTIISYLVKQKGKQMRPMLVFLSAKLNGEVTESTYNAASLIELMHTATLIHDDVVDDSNMRRGFFSINALWKNKVAVLLGDYLLAKGLLLAVKNKEYEILRIVSEAVEQMSEGEILQIEKARKLDIDEETYYEIIRKKTAALMVACTAAGTQSVGISGQSMEQMRLLGDHIGMAFQIRDDLFDFDSGSKTGKPNGNDIIERKMTLPFIYALNHCKPAKKREMIRLMREKKKSRQIINQIMEFVNSSGGIDYATAVMNQHKQSALDILARFPQNEANHSLAALIEYTINRSK